MEKVEEKTIEKLVTTTQETVTVFCDICGKKIIEYDSDTNYQPKEEEYEVEIELRIPTNGFHRLRYKNSYDYLFMRKQVCADCKDKFWKDTTNKLQSMGFKKSEEYQDTEYDW